VRKTKFTRAKAVLYYSRALSHFNALSINPSPELKLCCFDFEKRAGTTGFKHQIVDKLENGESADSVVDVLQESGANTSSSSP
jgi:hypothetical protein